jgi:SAM-dependent methyltransferase
MPDPDARQFAPAVQRNREPILAVLQQVLPNHGVVLEVASGTGEHGAFFAPQLPHHFWLPSDTAPEALASIRAWQVHQPIPNFLTPLTLEVSQPDWPDGVQSKLAQPPLAGMPLTAIVNINMIHISPWSATVGLMAGAKRLLPPGGILYLYGPYQRDGKHTAPSNEAFDTMLRSRNPAWGVRSLEAVIALAARHGLQWRDTVSMPANNFSVIFARSAEPVVP